jgi:predicted NBD/HSP70 family sugar kinase
MHFTKTLTNIEAAILTEMWPAREVTRTALERALEHSRPTVDKALRSLQDQGLISLEGRSFTARGRPAETFHIRSDAWCILGMDFEMPNVDLVLTDALGGPIEATHFVTERDADDSRKILQDVTASIQEWLGQLPQAGERLSAMGVGLPGYFSEGGLSLAGLNMPAWREVPVRNHFERSFSVPVVVGHDVHFMAVAEIEHRGWNDDVVLYLALRPGFRRGVRIGACLSTHGRPYKGAHGNGGALYRAIVPPEALQNVTDAERAELIAERTVASLVHLIPMTDPDHIVFHGGEIGALEPLVIERCEALLRKALQGEYIGTMEISPALVRGASGAQRAAIAAIRGILTPSSTEEVTEKGG